MMKKEKLEQMKELGRGGLSKGLTMLRNAAEKAAAAAEAANEKNAQHAALEDGSSDAAAAGAGAAASGSGSNRLTYDELVTLSMKLTRQNKMMKAQFQKIQARITALSVKEANERVLTDFVKNVVRVDLDACHVDESKSSSSSSGGNSETASDAASSSEQSSAAVKATIDAAELKQRYEIQCELNEREHRLIEEQLRAELAALQSRTTLNGRSSSDAAAPSDVESVSLLSFSPVGAPPAPELRNYDEIDLLNEPLRVAPSSAPAAAPAFPAFDAFANSSSESSADTVARLEKQLAAAQAELEQLRSEAERSARGLDEQVPPSASALAQRGERVTELETALADLQRTLGERESSEQAWQARWDEQTQTLAGLRAELALKTDAASSLAAENATVAAQLEELKTALAAAAGASPVDSADSDTVVRLTADVARLSETIVSLEGANTAAQASLDQARGDHDALSSAHSALKTELDAKRMEIETLRREIASLEEIAAANATDATQADREELARLEDAVASLTKSLADKDAQVAALERALASARTECDALRGAAAAGAVKADPSDERAAEEREALGAELAQLRDTALALAQENASLKAQLSSASEANATTASGAGLDDASALLDELERVKMARAEVDHALRTAQDKLRAVEAQLRAAQEETEGSRSLVDALKADTSRLVDELAASERSRAHVQSELDALVSAKAAVDEELSVLRHDSHANLEQTLSLVEALKTQVSAAEVEKAQAESRMAEEREYLKSKIESLIKEHAALDATLADRDKQVTKMAASQASMTAEMMELQTQVASMREDLHMAADGLEAHAVRAEQSDLKRHEVEGKMANLKLQMDALRDQHCTDFEMLRQEKESELERVKLERHALAQKLSALEATRTELEAAVAALECAVRDEQARVAELEAIASQQTTEIGHLSVDLAETKKALSDRMGLATRLQTENMGIAAKQAEQAALIENALKDAAASRAKTDAMAAQLNDATAAMVRATQLRDETTAAMRAMERDVAAQTQALEAAQARAVAQCQADVSAERAACKREIERVEAESKHKSKLALQAVLEKEAEIARLSTRLAELEEDVRSGDADHRKIFEVAQLQAKREAESRAQALQLQDMAAQLDAAQRQIQRLQDEKLAHESELTALMQTQRREGVNMEYLKNVVVQYMSFRPGSSQQARLVPVLSTLLQFSAHDMKEIKNASSARRSSWTSWGTETKDYKPILDAKTQRHSMLPPSPGVATGAPSSARASSFTLPHAMASASSDPSAFASHAASESHDF